MRAIQSSEPMVENIAPGSCYRDSDPMSLWGGGRGLHFKEALVGVLMQGIHKHKLKKLPKETGPSAVGIGCSKNKPMDEGCLCPF